MTNQTSLSETSAKGVTNAAGDRVYFEVKRPSGKKVRFALRTRSSHVLLTEGGIVHHRASAPSSSATASRSLAKYRAATAK